MRHLLVVPCAAWIAACYSPNDEVTTGGADDSEGSGSGSTAGMTASSATTTPADTSGDTPADTGDTTDDPTGDTGEDAPPVIESFSVQGSLLPAEILMADTVVLAADVTDDVGVARVEFYDGGTLVATVDGAPWRTEFLVTSADNGGHSYTAVAYDTAEQTAEAGPIPMSVNIDGGAVIELREEVFRAIVSLGLNSPYLLQDATGVTLVGTTEFDGGDFVAYRMTSARYSLGLSQTWLSHYPASPIPTTPDHYSFGRGGVEEDGNLLFPCNVGVPLDEAPVRILRADADANGAVTVALSLNDTSGGSLAGLTVLPDFDVVVGSRPLELSRYPAALGAPAWSEDISAGLGAGGPLRLHADSTGAVLIDGLNGAESFLRKVSSDGVILWTRESDDVAAGGVSELAYSAVGPADQVTQVAQRPEGSSLGLRALTYDSNGALLHDVVLAENEELSVHDVAYDPSGSLVVVATLSTGDSTSNAWIGRFDPSGTELWTTSGFVDDGDEEGYAVQVRPDGRLFVSGIANTTAEFLATSGDAWIAELRL